VVEIPKVVNIPAYFSCMSYHVNITRNCLVIIFICDESETPCPLTLGGVPGVLVMRYFQLCRKEAVKPSNLPTSSKFPAVYMLKNLHALRKCIISAEINHLSVALQLLELVVHYSSTVPPVCLLFTEHIKPLYILVLEL
jgi:hypothetical protein